MTRGRRSAVVSNIFEIRLSAPRLFPVQTAIFTRPAAAPTCTKTTTRRCSVNALPAYWMMQRRDDITHSCLADGRSASRSGKAHADGFGPLPRATLGIRTPPRPPGLNRRGGGGVTCMDVGPTTPRRPCDPSRLRCSTAYRGGERTNAN